MWKILALASFALVTALPAHGKQVIVAFDLSPVMGERCPGSEVTPLMIAKSLARQRLAGYAPGDSAAIIGFTTAAEVLHDELVATSEPVFARIESAKEGASLRAALVAARELIQRRGTGESQIIVFSAGGEDPLRSLVQAVGELSADGVPLELMFFDPRVAAGADDSPEGDALLRIGRYGCGGGDRLARDAILQRVRQIISRHTGVPSAEIAGDASLGSFAADRLQAYEIVADLGAEFNLRLPGENVPTIAAIVDLVAAQSVDAAEEPAPATEMHIDAAPAFAAGAPAKQTFFKQKIFYATNRKRTGKAEPVQFYGGERAPQGKTEYGTCIVTIPASHKEGAVETPFLGLSFLEDASQHIRLMQLTPIGRDDFFRSLQGSLSAAQAKEGWENDAVVFIHGFNVPFDEAAKRTAQMAFDFGFKGAPILFSWPSDGKFYAYMADREDVQWSVQHIERFLDELAENLLPRRIHLVAHSMGNQGLIGALNMLAIRRGAENRPLFENVILAAPDFDAQLFQEQIAPRAQKIAKRWTVYTSDNDAALNISTTLNSARRLGLPVTPVSGIDVVDATGIEVTPWSVPEFHSYYATKQTVIQDIVNTIKGVAPSMRALLPKAEAGVPYWRLGAAIKGN